MRSLDRRTREALLCGLVLCQLAYSWMYSAISVPNERTRSYLTIAIVDHGTFAIDEPLRRFGRVYDLANFAGHYYTDKAPGASLLAVPIYALARIAKPAAAFSIVDVINLARTYLMLPIGLLGFIVLRSLLRALRVSESSNDVCSIGFSLGSPMLHYSGAFYSHAIVAVFALLALWCLAWAGVLPGTRGADVCSPGRRMLGVLAAGACAGVCGLAEYQAVVLAGLLGLPILFHRRRSWLRDLALFGAGAVPFAAVLLAYNARAFGGAFALSYQHLVGDSLQELHGYGLAGATHPHWGALVGLLFSQHRGVVFSAPLPALGLLALLTGYRSLPRALWITFSVSVAYFVLIVASSSVWYGGWGFGPRLLIPVFGPLAIAAACLLDALRGQAFVQVLARAAVVFGVIYQDVLNITFSELPPEFTRPLVDSALPLLHVGLAAPNLACKLVALGPGNWWTLAPLLGCTVAIVVGLGSGMRARTGWLASASALALAAAVFMTLAAASPSGGAGAPERWLRQVRVWQSGEQRCAG